MPENLTERDFAENLKTKFRVPGVAPEPVELEVVGVKGYGAGPGEQGGMERFSVYLYGPGGFFLPQGTYTLEHDRLGRHDLFVVPVGRDERGFQYEMVFNYFRKSDE